MPDFTQEISFEKSGLDWDTDKRFVAKGDSEYRLNCVPNQPGNALSITNIQGNTKYTHSFTHSATYAGSFYTVIGSMY